MVSPWQLRKELLRTAPLRVAEFDALQKGGGPQAIAQLALRQGFAVAPQGMAA